jgi:GntR family transcriptional regulator
MITADQDEYPGVPLRWERVAGALRRDILSGQVPPGVALMSSEVKARLGCTTGEARQAMRALEGEGLLRHDRYGTWLTGTADPAADKRMGDTLARLRNAAGLNPGELAAAAGRHPSHLDGIEAGTWKPRDIWESLDYALGADGTLLRLHDSAYAPRPLTGPGRREDHQASQGPPAAPAGHPYAWVTEQVRARITSGEWPPGSRLPAQLAMAEQHGTHTGGIRAALFDLAAEGLLIHRYGEGFYVAGQPGPATRAITEIIICWADGTRTSIHCPSLPATTPARHQPPLP